MAQKPTPCDEQSAGVCPVCGCNDLEYGDSGIQDESYIYDWTCPQCGSSGKECHSLVFEEHIFNGTTDT